MKLAGNERGLTLVEFTIVAALGTVVMLTISSFYLASQSMWLDSSIQAVAQRDASMFANEIGHRIEAADKVLVSSDSTDISLQLNGTETSNISWDPDETFADIVDYHEGGAVTTTRWPANGRLKSLRFHVEGGDPRIVYLDSLRIELPSGEALHLSSAFGLYNHP